VDARFLFFLLQVAAEALQRHAAALVNSVQVGLGDDLEAERRRDGGLISTSSRAHREVRTMLFPSSC